MSFIGPLFLWLQDREGLKRSELIEDASMRISELSSLNELPTAAEAFPQSVLWQKPAPVRVPSSEPTRPY